MTRVRLRCAALVAGAWLAFGGAGTALADTPEEIFDRGNDAYEAGRFQEAREAYRAVLRYGIEDVRVEYNVANAEFKLGNLGQAILHYRRAHRLDPTDDDVRHNLALVESYTQDQVEPIEVAPAVQWLRLQQDRLGPDRQAVLALALLWAVAGLIGWCSARPGGWNAGAGWVLAGLALVLVLAVASWQVTAERLEGRRTAVVLEDSVEVLAGPGDNNATLFTIHEGLTVQVRADRGEWFQVSLPNGLSGWLLRDSVGVV